LIFSKFKEYIDLFNKKGPNFIDITKYGCEQYQDIIINNKVVKKASGNHCASELRYKIIQEVLNKYNRRFTMLDIGASQGYYSFRTAHDYNCICVMIEGDNPSYPKVGRQLLDLCKANSFLENIILLNKEVIPEDLKKLSECESFSVVLALNIIHWFGPRWKEVTDAILQMGDNVIIETPPQEDEASKEGNLLRRSIEEYLIFKKAKILGEVPRHTSDKMTAMYLFETEKKKLARKQWLAPKESMDHLSISSNYKAKIITKLPPHASDLQANDWQPGINLMSYLMYSGAYPTRKTIKKALKEVTDHTHNDWTVNNMILQGNKIALIDWDDPTHGPNGGRKCTPKVLKAHLRLASLKDPQKIEHYFYNHLIKT
jgi:hypothetical protein